MRHPSVEGVGINDADYPVGRGKCPYYTVWISMIQRCYSARVQMKCPTYVGCTVAPVWHTFSKFKCWMEQQDWKGKELDKDLIIPGNKEYGPNACLFVTANINSLLNIQPKLRGDLPIGVGRHGARFKASVRKNMKHTHIGVFDTVEEAAYAYREAKAAWIEHHASIETCLITKTVLLNASQRYKEEKF